VLVVEFLAELNEWGPIFTLWSNSEDRLQHALAAVAKSTEQCFLALQALVSASVIMTVVVIVTTLQRLTSGQSFYSLPVVTFIYKTELISNINNIM